MKRLVFLFLVLLSMPAAGQGVIAVDRIVAVVNKDVITATELSDAVAAAQRQLRRQKTPLPERGLLERQMLERLILDKAQLQFARDKGIRIDELQLDRAVQRVGIVREPREPVRSLEHVAVEAPARPPGRLRVRDRDPPHAELLHPLDAHLHVGFGGDADGVRGHDVADVRVLQAFRQRQRDVPVRQHAHGLHRVLDVRRRADRRPDRGRDCRDRHLPPHTRRAPAGVAMTARLKALLDARDWSFARLIDFDMQVLILLVALAAAWGAVRGVGFDSSDLFEVMLAFAGLFISVGWMLQRRMLGEVDARYTGAIRATAEDADPAAKESALERLAVRASGTSLPYSQGIAIMVFASRKRPEVNRGHFLGIVALTLVNAAVAVFW